MSQPPASTPDALPFTGERFTPECVREMRYEHWHRYAFAAGLGRKRVLDAACGEGYGSALLARHGADVVGVDVSEEAIAHARARYGEHAGLRFVQADCTQLEDFDGPGFDLIVSFETLEHVEQQDRMLAGFASLLEDDGLLLVSSPDRHTYSDVRGFQNEFHVRELYRHELEALLSRHFPAFRLFGQKLLFQSALWSLERAHGSFEAATLSGAESRLAPRLDYPPLYFVAACARHPDVLRDLPALSLFGDAEESVYAHYDHEVRKNMAAGARIQELEQQLETLQRRLRSER